MAVTKVVLRERKGKETLTGGKRVRTYQAVYHVKCNSINEDPRTILDSAGLPTMAPISTWPMDSGALLVERDPQQDRETPDLWVVTLSYTSNPDIKNPEDNPDPDNPLLKPAVVSRSPVQRQRVLERDANDDLIVNKADDKFVPPVEREEHPPSFTISKNVLVWPYALENAYTDAINSDAVVVISKGISAAVGCMKFNGFSGNEQYENGIHFWTLSGSFEVDWQGWNKPILNVGTREKFIADDSSVHLIPIIGSNGESITDPVKLNNDGTKASPFASPIYLPFKKYRELPFATLMAIFGL